MLKNIDPLLSADLLHVLAAMGHGDDLALVDRNFPAAANAKRLVRLDGADILSAGRAILSVYPLDSFVDHPVMRMQMVGKPDEVPSVQQDFQKIVDAAEGRHWPMGSIERFAFYEAARQAFAVVATNDHHVMAAWARFTGGEGKILFLADGNGEFVSATGLGTDMSPSGYGRRSQWLANVRAEPRVRIWTGRLRAVPATAAIMPPDRSR